MGKRNQMHELPATRREMFPQAKTPDPFYDRGLRFLGYRPIPVREPVRFFKKEIMDASEIRPGNASNVTVCVSMLSGRQRLN